MTANNADLSMLSTATVKKVNDQAALKLAEITATSKEDCNIAEVIAAKRLLDRSMQRL